MLEIGLLGQPRITVDGKPLDVDTRKAVAMLAYMAVEGATARDTLTTLLWPEADPERAKAALRRTLSSLRSGVKGHIDADRNRVDLTGDIRIDIDEFYKALALTEEHGHSRQDVCPECVEPLMSATSLFRGEFLEGFGVRDAPMFEDWVRTTAEALRLKAGEAFNRLAHAHAAVGEYPGSIAAVNAWIEQDPLHEPAHRLRMLLCAWSGDRPGSIDAYRSFVGVLDRELGVSPLEETTELYEAILDEDLPPAPGMRRRIKTERGRPQPGTTTMLDRASQLDLLIAASRLDNAGRLVVIMGASWMGKTRLIEELARSLSGNGVVVLSARAFRMEQNLPYGVLTQLIEPLAELTDPTSISEWASVEISRLYPNFIADDAEGNKPFGEVRLFEAIREWLAAVVGEQQLVVVVVDDAQWADHASASLLAYMARRLSTLPLLLVVAVRSGEELSEPVQQLLKLADQTLELRPLLPIDIKDQVVDPATAKEIVDATGGVPLLILEAIFNEPGVETQGVARYLASRMAGLSDLARQLLATASVLTGVATTSLVREVSGRSDEEVVEGIEELLHAGLLAEVAGSDNLGFALDAVERIVYDETSLVRRRLLHRRAAAALERVPWARNDVRLSGAIAAQLQRAGDPAAATWYRHAGDLARSVYAHDEARSFYESALALGSDDDGSLRLALAEVALARADYDVAKRELRVGASHAVDGVKALIEHRMGEVHRILGKFDLAGENFERARVEHPRPSELYADHALLHLRLGETQEAVAKAERAVELAREGDDDLVLSRSLNITALSVDDQLVAMALIDEALSLAADDATARMAVLNNKAQLLARLGKPDGAIPILDEAIALAGQTGHRHQEAALHNHLADLHHQMGNDDDSKLELTRAVSLFADIDAGSWEPELWLLRQW